MNLTIFKNLIKKNYKLWLIFAFVLTFYLVIIVTMFDPVDMTAFKELMEETLSGFGDIFGMDMSAMENALSYVASIYFSVLIMAFPMVYYLIMNNRLISKPVDNTSFSCFLSTPTSRKTIIATHAAFLIVSIIALFLVLFTVGAISIASFGAFNFWAFFRLNLSFCLLTVCIAMISFFLCCAFSGDKKVSLSIAVPIAFILIYMVGNAVKKNFIKYISPFGWLNSVDIVNGAAVWHVNLILIGLTALLFVLSIFVFNRKKLAI